MTINAKVLIIEDASKAIDFLSNFLEKEGCRIETARDGKSALAKVKSFRPECILLDLKLPKINGIQVLKAIKSKFPDIPVIIVSAVREFNVIQKCLREGAFTHMVKPVNLEDLRRAIKESLGHVLDEGEERRFEKKREEPVFRATQSKELNRFEMEALIQILVGKGILTRQEFAEKMKQLSRAK